MLRHYQPSQFYWMCSLLWLRQYKKKQIRCQFLTALFRSGEQTLLIAVLHEGADKVGGRGLTTECKQDMGHFCTALRVQGGALCLQRERRMSSFLEAVLGLSVEQAIFFRSKVDQACLRMCPMGKQHHAT